MVELQIKTLCETIWAGTNDDLLFTFCNSDQCCSTGGIQLTNGRQGSNGNTDDCNTPDIFGSSQIGDCKDFEIGSESIITGNITLSNTDGFRGESVKVASSDGSILQCAIDGWIDGESNKHPKYQNFSCSSLNFCPAGFLLRPGDIPGRGQIGNNPSTETTISDCSDRCNREPNCCSFEYSATEKKCNLNRDCQPTRGVHKDYRFCSKGDNEAKFYFNGTLQKTMEVYEYPSSIKVRWFNFLEQDDSDIPWVHCDGKWKIFPVTWSSGHFRFKMEKNMAEFDESITTDPKMTSHWAKKLRRPEEEIANIKFAMGFVTGQYENDIECVFGNDLGFRPDKGPNGEVAFAHRYAIFYRNGDLHSGPDNGDRSDESWWSKIPQGFSCGLGVDAPGFDDFVPVDCSEIVVKVAKAKSCSNNPDLGEDCFNLVNWI